MTRMSNVKTWNRILYSVLISIIFAASGPLHCYAAEEISPRKSIAILPLESHATKDLAYLQEGLRDMLASRLAANAGIIIIDKFRVDAAAINPAADPAQIRKSAEKLAADYIATGSITAIGSSMSLDIKVFDTAASTPAQTFYASAEQEEKIMQAVDAVSWDIAEQIFGKKNPRTSIIAAAPAQTAPAADPSVPGAEYRTPHPERAFMFPSQTGQKSFLIRPMGVGGGEFTKSQNFNMDLQAMDVADVDGDGTDEVILADKYRVTVYKPMGNTFKQIGQVDVKDKDNSIHAISIADLNKNGLAEIYVSTADKKDPSSFAIEWREQQFDYLFTDAPWYIRALILQDGRTILAGQQSDISAPIKPGIFEITTAAKPEKIQKLQVPAKVNLFDFTMTDLDANGTTEIVVLDENDRIRVMRPSGDTLWESDDYYGGTKRFIGQALLGRNRTITDSSESQERTYVPSRIIARDMNKDGQTDVIVNKNQSSASRVLKNMKSYPSGEIYCLTWNGISLAEVWHTMKIDGYIVDYQLVPDAANPDLALLYVGLQLRSGGLDVWKTQSTVLMYQLDFSGEEKK